jgi:universal stress protein A
MKRLRRILHATDFSAASKRAFDMAVEFAKQNKAELLLVHVLVPHVAYSADTYADPEIYIELERSARHQAQSSIAALVAKLKRAKVKATAVLLKGTAHGQIVRAA